MIPRTVPQAPDLEKRKPEFDVIYDLSAINQHSPVVKEGYLKKQGNAHKNWKKRWFLLDKSAVRYYRSRKDLVPIDVIELKNVHQITSDCLNEKRTKNNIQLHTPNRTYQIQAETPEERDKWLQAFKRNHELFHSTFQDKMIQKNWIAHDTQGRSRRGNCNFVELYGKHLSFARSYPTEGDAHSLATDIYTWHIDDIAHVKDVKNERLEIQAFDEKAPQFIELSTLDARGKGANEFLDELHEAVTHNKTVAQTDRAKDKTGDDDPGADKPTSAVNHWLDYWPVRYKRGYLNVFIGKHDARLLWVQVGGLVLSYYEKAQSLQPAGLLDLGKVEVQLEHNQDDRNSDRIVLRPLESEVNSKTWVTLSGDQISSLKPSSELNRMEWVVALCGNTARLAKQAEFAVDSRMFRFKRGWMKSEGVKLWCELDEYTFRIYSGAKAPAARTIVMLTTVSEVRATSSVLLLKTINQTEHLLSLDNFAGEWKNAIDNNVAILKQIEQGKVPNMPAMSMGTVSKLKGVNGSEVTGIRGAAEIAPEEITITAKLGDGCFGAVYRGICRANDVAVKIPLVQQLDEHQLQQLRREVEIMSANPHPNIVLCMGACTIPGQFKIVTELMMGDLDTLIKRGEKKFSLFERMRMAKDAALGVNWLHRSNPQIIHRDLKTANLLYNIVGNVYKVKVCDFGLSVIKPKHSIKDTGGAKGTPLFMVRKGFLQSLNFEGQAPEVMLQEEFDEKADVYSFGIVLWEILTGKDPFPHHSEYAAFVRAIVEDEERPPIPSDCPPRLRSLIEKCWDAYPENRPDFEEINAELDEIIVECAIADQQACSFWKQYFLKDYSVKWIDFVHAFYEYLETPLPPVYFIDEGRQSPSGNLAWMSSNPTASSPQDLRYKSLKALLCEHDASSDEREVVNIAGFDNFVKWFGPVRANKYTRPDYALLDKINSLLAQGWFHGPVSSTEAQRLLAREEIGTFLLRFSSSTEFPGAFVLTRVSGAGAIDNLRILQPNGCGRGFVLDKEHNYPSLMELVTHVSGLLHLAKPCPGSRYSPIFSDPTHIPLTTTKSASNYGIMKDLLV